MDKVKIDRTDREVEVREDPTKQRVWQPAALLPEFTQKPGWVYPVSYTHLTLPTN